MASGMFKFLGGSRADPRGTEQGLAPAGKDQRELVRVALKTLLAEQGIPLHWIGFEMDRALAGAPTASLAIRLVVQEWQEPLLRYLPAISAAVVARLGQLDRATDHQHDSVSWSFAADCGYPVTAFPAPSVWGGIPVVTAIPSAKKTAALEAMLARTVPSIADFDAAQQTQPMNLDEIPSDFMASIPAHLDSEPVRESVAGASKAKFDLPRSPLDGGSSPFASTEPGKLP